MVMTMATGQGKLAMGEDHEITSHHEDIAVCEI